ncbi:MAG: extracellular solute-binding protein [Lentisphaerota bacterium]
MKKIHLITGIVSAFLISLATLSADTKVGVLVRDEANSLSWFKYLKTAYESSHPGSTVNLNIIGGTESDFFTKSALMLKTSTSIDVMYEDSFMLLSDVDAGVLSPIDGIEKWQDWAQFYQTSRNFATIKGKIYGVPLSTDTRGIYYNKDLFAKAGIKLPWQPKNWNDIIETAKTIKEKDSGVAPFSFAVSASGEGTSMQTFEMFLYGTDNTLYKDGKWVVTSQGFLDSLRFINTIFREKLGPSPSLVFTPQYGANIAMTVMPHNKAAMVLDGCWLTGVWKGALAKTLSDYDFAAMPTQFGQGQGFTTMVGGFFLSIPTNSKQKELGLEFIKFALNKENELKYSLMVGNLCTREDAVSDATFPAHLKYPSSLIKYGYYRPANQQYPTVSTYIQSAVESVALGSATPEQAMNTYAASVIRSLGKNSVIELPVNNQK